MRGEKTDPAVLCTRDHTYDVREAETSNTLLMMPELDFPSQLESYSEPVILHRTVSVCQGKRWLDFSVLIFSIGQQLKGSVFSFPQRFLAG